MLNTISVPLDLYGIIVNGLDRTLKKSDPENVWYFDLLESEESYNLNVDNDEG